MKMQQYNVLLPPLLVDELKAFAVSTNVTASDVIRNALIEYLKAHQEKVEAPSEQDLIEIERANLQERISQGQISGDEALRLGRELHQRSKALEENS